ncbi:MAG: DUF2059 domain-containing protein [Bacteroidota bacterium]
MKRLFILSTICLLCSSSFLMAQEDSYKQKVIKYLEVTHADKTFEVAIGEMVKSFKKMATDVPEKWWDEMEKEMLATSLSELADLFTPIYSKHFTEEEFDELIAFFESPIGKKFGEKTPLITQESMAAGREWGSELSEKMIQRLKDEGYDF